MAWMTNVGNCCGNVLPLLALQAFYSQPFLLLHTFKKILQNVGEEAVLQY